MTEYATSRLRASSRLWRSSSPAGEGIAYTQEK